MISPLPYATTLKPGSATYPLPGIDAAIYDEDGNEAAPNEGGHLVIRKPWPGMLRGVYKNPERFKKTYFNRYKDTYDPEDGARKDEDGCFWIMGRLDDVINVSGHRLGTAEIESALVSHAAVAEAAVVGMPHPVKGQTIFAYVTLMASTAESDELIAELRKHVRTEIGPIATPEVIMWHQVCRKPVPARSCAVSCARLPPTTLITSVTPPPWPILQLWTTWLKVGRACNPLKKIPKERSFSFGISFSAPSHK
ncbi:AMP-binding enzyme, partial [Candidatus Electrothrix communis]